MHGLMRARAEARFTGRVQGVYFRDCTRRFAEEVGLFGWVMNMDDGSVRMVFEGEREDIEKVLRKLRTEHPAARVDSVEINWFECKGEFDCFEIRYSV
jgi:acylphosphatase